MLKKLVSMLCIGALLVSSLSFTVFAGYTQPTSAETQFSEDFEAYQLINDYDSSRYLKIDTANGNSNSYGSGQIYCGVPSDGDYSDTTVYPYGTASVYEGNLDDSGNTFVHDYKYKNATATNQNKVNGGTVNLGQDDGWYGYTNSAGQQFSAYNRRLAVFDATNDADLNKTQYAILQPHPVKVTNADSSVSYNATYSVLNRNNIALDGYSYLSARVSLSTLEGKNFTKAGIAISKNPNDNSNDGINEVVYFVPDDEGKDKVFDVVFGGQRIAEVVDTRFEYAKSSSSNAAVAKSTSTGEWYTIQYRIYKGEDFAKHKITIIDDKNKKIIADTDWKNFTNFDFAATTYGLRFYAQVDGGVTDDSRTCMRLDDINFYNGEFIENFNSYNVKTDSIIAGKYSRIGSGVKGNTNISAIYGNGAWEAHIAKNVFIYRTLSQGADTSSASDDVTEDVFGGLTNWQGYVKQVKNASNANLENVAYLYASSTNRDNYPLYIRNYGAKSGTNAIFLRANAAKAKAPQRVYVGMENVDFSDKTTISAQVKVHQVRTKGEAFKFQLTKGKNTFGAKSANYDDSTITANYDVFTMTDDGKIKVGEKEIGTYEIGTAAATYCYNIEYTVNLEDKQNPKHSLKIYDADTNSDVAVATLEETAMNLTEGDANFNFDNDVVGFRFVADSPSYTSSSDYSDIIAYVDDVKVSKTLSAAVTCENKINNAVYSAEVKTLNCSIEMTEALASGTVVFAVYNKEDDSLANIHTLPVENLVAGNNDGIKITDLGEYDAQNYYGKVFLWNSLTNITPYAKVGNVDFN